MEAQVKPARAMRASGREREEEEALEETMKSEIPRRRERGVRMWAKAMVAVTHEAALKRTTAAAASWDAGSWRSRRRRAAAAAEMRRARALTVPTAAGKESPAFPARQTRRPWRGGQPAYGRLMAGFWARSMVRAASQPPWEASEKDGYISTSISLAGHDENAPAKRTPVRATQTAVMRK
jgi:hypothetical protein